MTVQKDYLPFALPDIGEEEIKEVVECLRSGWITTGKKAKRFEDDFANMTGAKFALAINSATAGLHLALEAVGIKPGDKVITSPYTFTATAEVIRYLGADPLFVDINPRTLNIDVDQLERLLARTSGVKAIIPVHIAGQSCEMEKILRLGKEYGAKIIEDAAHALPTTYRGKMIGTLGDLTVFSFYATKTITTGEGGMVTTQSEAYANRIKTMRLHGINSDVFARYTSNKPSWYYEVVAPGYKYNLTDIAASIGIHQLQKSNAFHHRRTWIAHQYTAAFAGLPIELPFVARPEDVHAWHLYVIQLKLDELTIDRDQFIELMSAAKIGTSVHFIPLHIQPYWRDKYSFIPDDFPIANSVYHRAVSLPIYPKMSDDDVQSVIKVVREIINQHLK